MTTLSVFTYSDVQIRTVLVDGDPWFVLADLCAVLEIANPRNVAARIPNSRKGVRPVDTLGGQQNLTVVDEPGAYMVVMRSDKPAAVAFQEWLAEVATQIRRTGRYETQPVVPQSFAAALQLAADQARQLEDAEKQLAIAAPKVAYVDTFVDTKADGTTVRMLASQLCISEPKLRAYLIERKVLSRRTVYDFVGRDGKRRIEYEWQARVGFYEWFNTKDHPEAPRMYNGQTRSTLYVTPLGKVGIADLLKRHPIAEVTT